MTFREKFYEDYPECEGADPVSKECPSTYGYEVDWDCTDVDIYCEECWNREIPERRKNKNCREEKI